MRIAYLIITHNRITDAKIQMDIIDQIWRKAFHPNIIDIFHSFNGIEQDYPKPYIEKCLIRSQNTGYPDGAADLIDIGIKEIIKHDYDYIIIASSDVWILKPRIINNLILKMQQLHNNIATSKWAPFFHRAYATEFFIIQNNFAKSVFPLNIHNYRKLNLFDDFIQRSISIYPIVEHCFFYKVNQNKSMISFIPNRKYVTWFNNKHIKEISYYSHHNIHKKISLTLKEIKKSKLVTLKNIYKKHVPLF